MPAAASPQLPTDLATHSPHKPPMDDRRRQAIDEYQRLLLECREKEARLKELRLGIREFEKQFNQSERDIQALQSVGHIIGEVLKELDGTTHVAHG